VVIVLVAAVALIVAACGGPPSAAGLASESPSALESGSAGSASPSAADASLPAGASTAPTPSPKPTPRPTPKPTPRPTATPNTKPAIVSYQIPSTVACGYNNAAVQIQITWIVKLATGVTISIDGPGIFDTYPGASGLATVPFECGVGSSKHTYTLTTTGGTGPAAHATKTVKRVG
jgi:hypothetical protein